MINVLFLGWQEPKSRRWIPIGRLERCDNGGSFLFRYVEGFHIAAEHGFRPFPNFPDKDLAYRSKTLFPTFGNRLMNPARSDFQEYATWLHLKQDEQQDPFLVLARESRRLTDHLELFALPEPEDGQFNFMLPLRGLRHRPDAAQDRALNLKAGEKLHLCLDVQNDIDRKAVLIRTSDQHLLGFVPRYLAEELYQSLLEDPSAVQMTVADVNVSAPPQYRVFCRLVVPSTLLQPYSQGNFTPLADSPCLSDSSI